MDNFIDYISSQIQLEMRLSATGDPKRLMGFRNIKSEFLYLREKNDKLSETDIMQKMYNSRMANADIYKDVNDELRFQELIEAEIIKPFLPEELNWQDVFNYLDSIHLNENIEKTKKSFKIFQDKCTSHFGQKVDSKVILDYIDTGI